MGRQDLAGIQGVDNSVEACSFTGKCERSIRSRSGEITDHVGQCFCVGFVPPRQQQFIAPGE